MTLKTGGMMLKNRNWLFLIVITLYNITVFTVFLIKVMQPQKYICKKNLMDPKPYIYPHC